VPAKNEVMPGSGTERHRTTTLAGNFNPSLSLEKNYRNSKTLFIL